MTHTHTTANAGGGQSQDCVPPRAPRRVCGRAAGLAARRTRAAQQVGGRVARCVYQSPAAFLHCMHALRRGAASPSSCPRARDMLRPVCGLPAACDSRRSCLQQPGETVRGQVLEAFGCWLKLSCGANLPPGLPDSPLVSAALQALSVDGTFHAGSDAVRVGCLCALGVVVCCGNSAWRGMHGRSLPGLLCQPLTTLASCAAAARSSLWVRRVCPRLWS
jgi:hypothetical protein